MKLVHKLLLCFGIVITAALLLIGSMLTGTLNEDTEKKMQQDAQSLIVQCETSIKHSLQIEEMQETRLNFIKLAKENANDLSKILGKEVAYYTPKGEEIYATYDASEGGNEAIEHAMEGDLAYTVFEKDNLMFIYFAFPIENTEGDMIGLLKVRGDYSEWYQSLRYLKSMILFCSLGVLFLALGIVVLFLVSIIKPARVLSAEMQRFSLNPMEVRTLPAKRRDEIGDIIKEYNHMEQTIYNQLITIEKERQMLSDALQYKKTFYDNLTHELKTPLTIIIGYAEMMQETNFEDQAFAEKGTEQIITEGKRLKNMVHGLLESSKYMKDSQRKEQVDLSLLIQQVISSFDLRAEQMHISIISELEQVTVYGNYEQLRMLFLNLIDNAMKYGRAAEPIIIKMSEEEDRAIILVKNKVEPGKVNDTEKIFLPFYRARDIREREKGSVGLGLSVAKNIVDEHRGSILARTEEDDLIFEIHLPCCKSEEQ